ncbi:MAG: hypothetical protein GY941_19655 [Planctomycetes bacterium]|nr:hypothetical protein [Planctomycetota bacterium]
MNMHISARKLESYRRAEVVGQALRKYIAAGPKATQGDRDTMMDALLDWMGVTGKIKFDIPKRRGRVNHGL